MFTRVRALCACEFACVCTFHVTYRVFRAATHCNTLQHTATHCNTLQHTATHCNTLQHTATHRNTLQHAATHCNTLQHTATHRNTLQHAATQPLRVASAPLKCLLLSFVHKFFPPVMFVFVISIRATCLISLSFPPFFPPLFFSTQLLFL